MAGRRSPTNRDSKSPKVDDLKLINGIGPAVEKRLNGVGIYTFVQLAVLSPADIAAAVADLAGLSSERIIKQDWIGQARKLAVAEAAKREVQEDVEFSPGPVVISPLVVTPPQEQQGPELIAEAISSETQMDTEAPEVAEQIATSIAPIELLTPVEHTSVPSVEPEKDVVLSMEPYRPTTFTIQLLLDEHDNVYSTHIIHVQSKREHIWRGWQEEQLVGFLKECAGLNIPSDVLDHSSAGKAIGVEPIVMEEHVGIAEAITSEEPIVVEEHAGIAEAVSTAEPVGREAPVYTTTVVPERKLPTPSATDLRLAGKLRLSKMEVIGAEASDIGGTLTRDEPFNVRLTLDLTEFQLPDDIVLNYKAAIQGKERVSRSSLALGEVQGTIVSADTVTVNVACLPLSEGFYRLTATVIVALPDTKLSIRTGTTAVIGSVVQVY